MFDFIEAQGVEYHVYRNNELIHEYKGLINREQSTNLRYIGFYPNDDVQIGDWLSNEYGDKFIVTDRQVTTFMGKPHQLKCMIQSEAEYNSYNQSNNPIFNIGNAYGSVIGTQANVTLNYNDSIQNAKEQIASTSSSDKEELQQIITLLEMIINDQVPASKGLFSKFSAVMERNSWITGSIAGTVLGWLTTQIH